MARQKNIEKKAITKPVLKLLKKKLTLSDVINAYTETLKDCVYLVKEFQKAKKEKPGYEVKRTQIEMFGYEWALINELTAYMLTNLELKVGFGKASREFHKFFVLLCEQVRQDTEQRNTKHKKEEK